MPLSVSVCLCLPLRFDLIFTAVWPFCSGGVESTFSESFHTCINKTNKENIDSFYTYIYINPTSEFVIQWKAETASSFLPLPHHTAD